MKITIGLVGLLAVALAVLWLLQGLGLMHVRPMLCFADCAEIQGRSIAWAIIGFVVAAAGAYGVAYGFLRRTKV
ncbi:hypothetical protein BH11PSE2_BH11PSE2_22590 [soil metagenome]